jgi:hypothetical protein
MLRVLLSHDPEALGADYGHALPELMATTCAASRSTGLPTPELRRRVLVDNPATVYGFQETP